MRSPKEFAALINAWLEEAPDDAAGIARALGDIARAKGMSQIVHDAELGQENHHKAQRENVDPSFEAVLKVARALVAGCMRKWLENLVAGWRIPSQPSYLLTATQTPSHPASGGTFRNAAIRASMTWLG